MKMFYLAFLVIVSFGAVAIVSGQSLHRTMPDQKTDIRGSAVVTVTAPTQFVPIGENLPLALTVSDTTGLGIFGYRGELNYNPNVIQISGGNGGCSLTGTISSPLGATCSDNFINATTRQIQFLIFGTTTISGSGDLIKFNFQVIGSAGASTPLVFTDFFFNEGNPVDLTVNGLVTVSLGTTAAGASVSGSVVSADGRPVANVRVLLTDGMDVVRYAITNPFGFYAFEDVPTGSVYVVNARSKRYTFAPRVITLLDDLAGLDLVAEP